jgi:hypothetical protein
MQLVKNLKTGAVFKLTPLLEKRLGIDMALVVDEAPVSAPAPVPVEPVAVEESDKEEAPVSFLDAVAEDKPAKKTRKK